MTRPAAISRIASGRSSCSVAWIASSSAARSRSGRHSNGALEDRRPGVDSFIDEVDGHASDLDAGLERLADRIQAGERG